MEDGTYQVTTPYLCAGFVVEDGRVTECAPILRKRLPHWQRHARLLTKGKLLGEFNKEASIVGQNAGGTAASLMAAFVGKDGFAGSVEEFLDVYNVIRTDVMNGSIALAGAEGFIEAFGQAPPAAAPRGGGGGRTFSRPSGGASRPSGGGGGDDPSTITLNFGKYKDQTLASVRESDPDYLDWVAENAQSPWLRDKVSAYLAAA